MTSSCVCPKTLAGVSGAVAHLLQINTTQPSLTLPMNVMTKFFKCTIQIKVRLARAESRSEILQISCRFRC